MNKNVPFVQLVKIKTQNLFTGKHKSKKPLNISNKLKIGKFGIFYNKRDIFILKWGDRCITEAVTMISVAEIETLTI